MENRPIILIGGSPAAGKTTIAHKLSQKLSLPQISTDIIRNIMRRTTRREDYPDLFRPEEYTAERFLEKFSTGDIVDIEIKQAEEVWPVIVDFVRNDHTWTSGFIIEGIGILPHLVDKSFKSEQNIQSIFLVDNNVERIRDVIYSRGLYAKADTYPDHVKEKEVEWVLKFNDYLERDTSKYELPLYHTQKTEEDLDNLISFLS